ncbi:MAG: FAD-dependent thymidylate synthase [Desulfurococcales archaeon]|nr:FAD-dependent thymidylate synthase [Desulfurococcales archaeon]
MSKVTLISWSGANLDDPRRLILLAVKTSAGKVKEKGIEYYLRDYPREKVGEWVKAAVAFPSVMEHLTLTFMVEGISRVTSHQLVRHRIASYTQESQRYSAAEGEFVIPDTVASSGFKDSFTRVVNEARKLYDEMVSAGVPYEDARFVLPQSVKTRLLMTVNLRELIHIACLRGASAAQWEIRELVKGLIDEARKVVPEIDYLVKEGCRRGI